jgi:hypothetical protein
MRNVEPLLFHAVLGGVISSVRVSKAGLVHLLKRNRWIVMNGSVWITPVHLCLLVDQEAYSAAGDAMEGFTSQRWFLSRLGRTYFAASSSREAEPSSCCFGLAERRRHGDRLLCHGHHHDCDSRHGHDFHLDLCPDRHDHLGHA